MRASVRRCWIAGGWLCLRRRIDDDGRVGLEVVDKMGNWSGRSWRRRGRRWVCVREGARRRDESRCASRNKEILIEADKGERLQQIMNSKDSCGLEGVEERTRARVDERERLSNGRGKKWWEGRGLGRREWDENGCRAESSRGGDRV